MDALGMILLTIPIFYPVAIAIGYDPIWFGVVIVLVTELGVITPPVGINVYVVSGIAKDVPLEVIFKGAFPFVLALSAYLIIMLLFPQIALFCRVLWPIDSDARPAHGTGFSGGISIKTGFTRRV